MCIGDAERLAYEAQIAMLQAQIEYLKQQLEAEKRKRLMILRYARAVLAQAFEALTPHRPRAFWGFWKGKQGVAQVVEALAR